LKSYLRMSEISLSCTLLGVRFYMSLFVLAQDSKYIFDIKFDQLLYDYIRFCRSLLMGKLGLITHKLNETEGLAGLRFQSLSLRGLPNWRTIVILPKGVRDFPILYFFRCLILFLTKHLIVFIFKNRKTCFLYNNSNF
jgi:hypothetical protein